MKTATWHKCCPNGLKDRNLQNETKKAKVVFCVFTVHSFFSM